MGGGCLNPLRFFSQIAKKTAARSAAVFCTPWASLAQLLVKKNDRVMSGHGVMTSFLKACSAPGRGFVMFRVCSATFSPITIQIMSESLHTRPMEVTPVHFGFHDLHLRSRRFFANNLMKRDTASRWSHCGQLVKTHRMMYLWTYFDQGWPLRSRDLRSNIDLDLSGSKHTYSDAPWREEHDGVWWIVALSFLVHEIFVKKQHSCLRLFSWPVTSLDDLGS